MWLTKLLIIFVEVLSLFMGKNTINIDVKKSLIIYYSTFSPTQEVLIHTSLSQIIAKLADEEAVLHFGKHLQNLENNFKTAFNKNILPLNTKPTEDRIIFLKDVNLIYLNNPQQTFKFNRMSINADEIKDLAPYHPDTSQSTPCKQLL